MKHYRVTEDGIEVRPGNLPKHKAEMPYPKYFETLQQARDFFYPGCDKPHPMPYVAPAPKITIALALWKASCNETICCEHCGGIHKRFSQHACPSFAFTVCGPTQTPLPGLPQPMHFSKRQSNVRLQKYYVDHREIDNREN